MYSLNQTIPKSLRFVFAKGFAMLANKILTAVDKEWAWPMAKRTCLGCGVELTGKVVTLDHALSDWLAKEIELPGVKLRHFLHDENKPEDTLLRSYQLNTFGSKKVCAICNNGWMSRLETPAKPLILNLMYQKVSILSLTDADRLTLSRWAVKTAFMISVVQTLRFELPWPVFQNLGKHENEGPNGCFVLATQQANLPKGFLYTCPSDGFVEGKPIQLRVGFSIHHLHFVVVIPIVEGPRAVRVGACVHVPLWPLDLHVLAGYERTPERYETADRFLDYLTNLVQVGVVSRKDAVLLEV